MLPRPETHVVKAAAVPHPHAEPFGAFAGDGPKAPNGHPLMKNRTFYGIRLRSTGALARIEVGEYGYAELTTCDHCPVWEAERPGDVARTLAENPIPENSSYDHPRWGRLEREDMEPVKVEVRVEATPMPVFEPVRFSTVIDSRDIPRGIARKYAGTDLPRSERYVLVLGWVPEGTTRADLARELTGRIVVFGSIYALRRVLAVAEPPPEFEPDFKGKPGVFLICTETVDGDPFDCPETSV